MPVVTKDGHGLLRTTRFDAPPLKVAGGVSAIPTKLGSNFTNTVGLQGSDTSLPIPSITYHDRNLLVIGVRALHNDSAEHCGEQWVPSIL